MDFFKSFTGNTLSLNDIFIVQIMPEKVIKNNDFVKHIAQVNVCVNSSINSALFYTIAAVLNGETVKTFKGTATLHKEDIEDALTGHDIAEHKALAKAYKFIDNSLLHLYDELKALTTNGSILRYATKAGKKYEKQLSCIQKKIEG